MTRASTGQAAPRVAHVSTTDLSLIYILKRKLDKLVELGIDVVGVAGAWPGPEHEVAREQIRRWKVPFHPVDPPMRREISPLHDLKSLVSLVRIFRETRPNIVHTHTSKAGILGRVAARIAGVPIVLHTCHGLPFYEGQDRLNYYLYVGIEHLVTLLTDRLYSQNHDDLKILEALGFPPHKLRYEGNGVEVEGIRARARAVDREALLTSLFGERHPSRILLCVGRIEPVKNHTMLIRALPAVLARFPDAVCLLAGPPTGPEPLVALLRELGIEDRVRFLGFRNDVPELLAISDALLLTSLKEGVPSIVMEACAVGCPVVATDVVGTRDIIQDRQTGRLVPVNDVPALSQAILEVLEDRALAARYTEAAGRKVEAEFDNERIARFLAGEYRALVQECPLQARPGSWLELKLKRALDLGIAVPALVAALPVLGATALTIRLRLGSPVFFRQVRPGFRDRLFEVVKFRTMTDARDADGNLLPDDQRLTGVGKLIRSLSLDELPQLWNVVKGDLSLVGPRPLLVAYLERYSPEQRRRHHVKPGLTGWAQVNGRNALAWEKKFELDVWYVDNWSLALDLKILILTVWKVLAREGISQEGQATMAPFLGNLNSQT